MSQLIYFPRGFILFNGVMTHHFPEVDAFLYFPMGFICKEHQGKQGERERILLEKSADGVVPSTALGSGAW